MDEQIQLITNNNFLPNPSSAVEKLANLSNNENNTIIDETLTNDENNPNLMNVKINEGGEVKNCSLDASEDLCSVSNKESHNPKDVNNSEADHLMKVGNKKNVKKKMKRIAVVDSDSDNEESNTENDAMNELSDEKTSQVIVNKQKRMKSTIYDSDSDETNSNENVKHELVSENRYMSNGIGGFEKTKSQKRLTIIDSDSEQESSFVEDKYQNESFTSDHFDPFKSSYLSALCDSEDSEDESNKNVSSGNLETGRPIISQRKNTSLKEKPPKKMTAKDAIKQRQEITSESQRMLRQTPLLLPYHKPKERTIKEFFQNRPRLSVLKIEPNLPVCAAIKMTTEELKMVTKKMEDREKEVQMFYKSESEDDDDTEDRSTPPLKEDINITSAQEIDANTEVITEIQDVQTENIDKGADEVTITTLREDQIVSYEELDKTKDFTENNVPMEVNTECEKETCTGNENSKNIKDLEIQNCDTDTSKIPIDVDSENKQATDTECKVLNSKIKETVVDNTDLTNSCKSTTKIIIHSVISIPSTSNLVEESVDYDFNLDDLDENVEPTNVDENRLKNLVKKYNDNETTDTSQVLRFKQQLLQQLGNCKPRLSGNPDEVIDFGEGAVKQNPVIELMERFIKHAGRRNVAQNKIELDIVNLSQGEIHKETVAIAVDIKEEESGEPIPGVKLKKLRNELQEQIAKQRTELWKQKNLNLDNTEIAKNCEKDFDNNNEDDEKFLDDEEEMVEDETTDEEDVCDDTKLVEEVRKKSAFVDDEAEVSDADASEEIASGRSSKLTDQLDDDNSNTNDSIFKSEQKKPLKRILKGFTEDSDDDDFDNFNMVSKGGNVSKTIQNDFSDDDVSIPPHQPRPDKTPLKETTETKMDTSFHTPIMQLTALQGLNSGSKFLHESPLSPFQFPTATPTEVKGAKQKLFADSCDPISFQDMEEIAQLCSGEFPSSDNSENAQNVEPTTQDLLSICSGRFTGITNNKLSNCPDEASILSERQELSNENALDEVGTPNLTMNTASDSKYLDEDRIISQLLDEEELEKFKKKFESPVAVVSGVEESSLEIKGGGKLIFDSSDDELTESNPKVTKTIHKRLEFSDDESSEEEDSEDEQIDLHDNEDDEQDNYKEIGYDSEENEIEQGSGPKAKLKSSDFFEKEAELSESDWDSADEDEGGLDALEIEQGDADVFDENKIKNDLEKIHMRRVLDEDNREIKILQEMLLEDGELHGTGRERQFRWRNIDDVANDERGPNDGDEVYLDEDEDESQWRRSRHEREMYLKSQEKQSNGDDIDNILSDSNSQVFKVGQESIRRSVSTTNSNMDKDKPALTLPSTNIKPSLFTNTRGSFLARTDKFLTRLADMTKVTSTVSVVKTSKKIVFQTNVSSENDELNSSNKRKATDGTPAAIKKLRLTTNLSPSLVGSNKKKKLF